MSQSANRCLNGKGRSKPQSVIAAVRTVAQPRAVDPKLVHATNNERRLAVIMLLTGLRILTGRLSDMSAERDAECAG